MQSAPALSRLALPMLLAAVALGAAPLAPVDEPSPTLKAVQGTWTTRDDAEVSAKWSIDGDAIKVLVNGIEYSGKVYVDDAAKPHPAFTIDIKVGPGDAVGKAAKGVYKLEGDSLKVNIAAPGKDRPVDFNPYGDDIYLFELTRKKDAG